MSFPHVPRALMMPHDGPPALRSSELRRADVPRQGAAALRKFTRTALSWDPWRSADADEKADGSPPGTSLLLATATSYGGMGGLARQPRRQSPTSQVRRYREQSS